MKNIGIGMIGTGFMAKTHSIACTQYPMMTWPPAALPVKKVICDVVPGQAEESARRFGYERFCTDYRKMLSDPEVDLVIITTPNHLHAQIAQEAAQAGKHILCEKPLGRNAAESRQMLSAAEKAGIKAMPAFNYRRLPAVVLAKKLLSDGTLGRPLRFIGCYLQDSGASPQVPFAWRNSKAAAGSGVLGDIGTHLLDIARYLAGEITEVTGSLRTVYPQRPSAEDPAVFKPVDVDDEFMALLRFENGAQGTLTASRAAWGRNNFIGFELYCEKGAVRFDLEHNGELQVYLESDPSYLRGFRTVTTGEQHPNGGFLWPMPGMGIGYSEPLMIQLHELLTAIVQNTAPIPGFYDGWRVDCICEAIARSSETGRWEKT